MMPRFCRAYHPSSTMSRGGRVSILRSCTRLEPVALLLRDHECCDQRCCCRSLHEAGIIAQWIRARSVPSAKRPITSPTLENSTVKASPESTPSAVSLKPSSDLIGGIKIARIWRSRKCAANTALRRASAMPRLFAGPASCPTFGSRVKEPLTKAASVDDSGLT
jgi:hypothetical protein